MAQWARAGYDPAAGASLWLKMEEGGGSNPLQFLSTHPSPDNRRQALLDLERLGERSEQLR